MAVGVYGVRRLRIASILFRGASGPEADWLPSIARAVVSSGRVSGRECDSVACIIQWFVLADEMDGEGR